jgi:predicted glycosyltransferase
MPQGDLTLLFTLILLFATFGPSQAIYFHMSEGEKKCFIEEIPDETMVSFSKFNAFYEITEKFKLPKMKKCKFSDFSILWISNGNFKMFFV